MFDYIFYFLCIALIGVGIKIMFGFSGGVLGWRFRRRFHEHQGDIKSRLLLIKSTLKRKWNKLNKKRKMELIDKEIYDAISFLRNVIAIDRGKQVSTDFIIEQLSEREGVLQHTYIRMLSLLRLNKKEEATQMMSEELQTSNGKEFAGLLLKWDEINPQELTEILLSHQKSIKEFRVTSRKQKDEMISDLIYFPVVMNVVFIFINFIYVGYFISQKEILQTIL